MFRSESRMAILAAVSVLALGASLLATARTAGAQGGGIGQLGQLNKVPGTTGPAQSPQMSAAMPALQPPPPNSVAIADNAYTVVLLVGDDLYRVNKAKWAIDGYVHLRPGKYLPIPTPADAPHASGTQNDQIQKMADQLKQMQQSQSQQMGQIKKPPSR